MVSKNNSRVSWVSRTKVFSHKLCTMYKITPPTAGPNLQDPIDDPSIKYSSRDISVAVIKTTCKSWLVAAAHVGRGDEWGDGSLPLRDFCLESQHVLDIGPRLTELIISPPAVWAQCAEISNPHYRSCALSARSNLGRRRRGSQSRPPHFIGVANILPGCTAF